MSQKTDMSAKVNGFLTETAQALCDFLNATLPSLGTERWWDELVVDKLTYQQQGYAKRNRITQLSALDLAALLRVLDQNWYDMGQKINFPPDAKHYLKEMQTVRNRWAHASVEARSPDDVYRDLDTLNRFLAVIGADDTLLERVRNERKMLIGAEVEARHTETSSTATSARESAGGAKFAATQIVHLKSDPNRAGPILAVQESSAENRYQVFLDGAPRWFYESQLEPAAASTAEGLVSLDRFHAHLTALQIQHPSLSTLYSLNAARVDFIPYQFRPVLKFIRADRPRLLIADGVGVGKTIEAGLILREIQARRDLRSVLIICPRPLVAERKWVMEMKRFEERFTQLDGNTLRHCISETDLEGEWPEQHAKTIIPYSLFDEVSLYGSDASSTTRRRKHKGLLDLDPPPRFDLVIVDEAHHVRNPNTYAHEAVRFFCDNAEAVVFLTATPIQLGSDDLFILLNLLRPDLIIDRESFEHMAAPNPHMNRAVNAARGGAPQWQQQAADALEDAARTAWGANILSSDPVFRRLRGELQDRALSPAERVAAIRQMEDLHTFSSIINRTRRRDIGEFTVREPQTVSVEFTPEQRQLHDALLSAQAAILSRTHPSRSINFMMTTIRRQAASCLFGLAPLIKDILTRRSNEIAGQESADDYEAIDSEGVEAIRSQIRDVLSLAGQLPERDPKLEALTGIIRDKQALPNNKLMVFSSFRHTLHYLFAKLFAEGLRVGLVHGGTRDEERIALRNRFRHKREQPDALDVLLFSEVGCEGLDYQFCDCIVNYDLPWNPMRVEQRIGRIDRNGQKSEKVLIYNLVTPGTVDADIYDRCLLRIGVFNNALGASEEILGEIAQQVRTIAEDIMLSESERQEKLQQIADNQIRLIQEQQQLEDKQAELFGIRLPADQAQKDIEGASSFWLSASAVQNLVNAYLQEIGGRAYDYILGEKPLKTLRMSQDGRARLLRDFQQLGRTASPASKQWENWLKGGDPHLAITFDAQEAVENPEVAFITPLHPLARQAARILNPASRKPICAIEAHDGVIAPGHYPFAIYEWRHSGMREDLALYPLAGSEEVSEKLPHFLEFGRPGDLTPDQVPDQGVFDALDAAHYQHWSRRRIDHQDQVRRIADYRRESLSTSHRARITMLEEKLAQATNDKIRRMRQAQLANAEADYQRRLAELEGAIRRADLNAQPVAYGVLIVKGETPDA